MVNAETHRIRNLEYYHKRRAELIEKLGGRCAVCGSTENLEFDHIDSSSKEINVSKCITLNFSRIEAELDKCQLLCHICHLKKTKECKDGNIKISDEIANKIRKEYSSNHITQKELGEKYGLKQREVSYVINNKRWRKQ